MLDSMIQDAPDPEKARQTLIRQVPLKRIGTTDDVAKMIVYLASDESTFVTGTEMVIDGGVVAQ